MQHATSMSQSISQFRELFKYSKLQLALFSVIFIVIINNATFFKEVLNSYNWADNGFFIISLGLCLAGIIFLIIGCLNLVIPIRLLVTLLLLVSTTISYFSDTFKIFISTNILNNIMQTHTAECLDIITSSLLIRLIFLGVLPAGLIWFFPFKQEHFIARIKSTGILIAIGLVTIIVSVIPFMGDYTLFIRENKILRYYTNPAYALYSSIQLLKSSVIDTNIPKTFQKVAKTVEKSPVTPKPKLMIFVLGEAARAQNFSLNNYERKTTNPLLEKQTDIINYTQFKSCGTDTAFSVPCLFSLSSRKDFNPKAAKMTENVLDILQRAGIHILWRDNNSGSKGVADRMQFENFTDPLINPIYDIESRDIGMLTDINSYLNKKSGNILIVLHQFGSHGPAYHKRYPKEFEIFKPTCKSSNITKCSQEELYNTYDNTILYTDFFLSSVITFLQDNSEKYQTYMLYVSDHGESLGENNIYLHGMPYFIAPEAQTHVPLIIWSSSDSVIDIARTNTLRHNVNTHDAIALTLLQIFEIKSDINSLFKDIHPLIYTKTQ